ncbi:hypothetical protein B0H14DRAFT_2710466 [Mycena olivaceomarginata]|nr:hypothetical protein B0H14DRAFT_2710466 [Mycena olivaceomarginata]
MSAAVAVRHVVVCITQPLGPLRSTYPAKEIISAQRILIASLMLASVPSTITIPVSPSLLPSAPLVAASIGARIPWPVWRGALSSEEIHLHYRPDYVKKELWSEGSVVPISSYVRRRARVSVQLNSRQRSNSPLRAILHSAHAGTVAVAPIHIRFPTLLSLSPSSLSSSPSPSSSSSVRFRLLEQ